MKNIFVLMIVSLIFLISPAGAAELYNDAQSIKPQEISVQGFRAYREIGVITQDTPQVAEILFEQNADDHFDVGIFDMTDNVFIPHAVKSETNKTKMVASTENGIDAFLTDNNSRTFSTFPVPLKDVGKTRITLMSDVAVTSSGFTVALDNYVALPSRITITAVVNGIERIVLKDYKMFSNTVQFPQTTADEWLIDFVYSQPLRISEMVLHQDDAKKTMYAVRFLAQPNQNYRVYTEPDRVMRPVKGEVGNFFSAKDAVSMPLGTAQNNEEFVFADVDEDTVPDVSDNCVFIKNKEQADINGNGRGDACDDFDYDGIINSNDNCVDKPNRNQADEDGDGAGDVCDGVESRLTEKYPWLPWLGMGAAALVLIILFAQTAGGIKKK